MNLKKVKLDKRAEKEFTNLFYGNKSVYEKIKYALKCVMDNPFIGKALSGDKKGCFRSRVGDYRIIYEIQGNEIRILKIGHRKDVYR